MSKVRFFTSDHHFGHKNILKYQERPFSSVSEMDEALVDAWNKVVGDDDIVYHLGDFTLGDLDKSKAYFKKLKGMIHVVPGGHDQWLMNFKADRDVILSASGLPVLILPPLYSLDIPSKGKYPLTVVMCHYAMRVWDRSHYGSLHLYGHSHGRLQGATNSMDVGVDTRPHFAPYSLDEILEMLPL